MTGPVKQIYLLCVPHGPRVVVRAACEPCARSQAAAHSGAEGMAVWRDPERSTCKRVTENGKSGIVLRTEAE